MEVAAIVALIIFLYWREGEEQSLSQPHDITDIRN